MKPLQHYIDANQISNLIALARKEDVGPDGIDITSDLFIPLQTTTHAQMRTRKQGILSGGVLLNEIAGAYDPAIECHVLSSDGKAIFPGEIVAEFRGPLRSILTMERVALNFVTHLSGIASLTNQYVLAVAGTKARICDTRKTLPGLRGLQKYAVACGGGLSHRIGLYDAMLIKDNHIAHCSLAELPAALSTAITKARNCPKKPAFIEVEVDHLDQLKQIFTLPAAVAPDMVLLDNMNLDQMREAVSLRNKLAPKIQLEASGGVNLQTVTNIAQTGVDRISIGALTHSAPSLDLGLDIA